MAGIAKFTPEIGQIFESKGYGPFKILEIIPSRPKENGKGYHLRRAKIVFINTGFVTTARIDHVQAGEVKDKLLPVVYGVGCIGYMDHFYSKYKREYGLWCRILSRCYNKEDSHYHEYGGRGVRVVKRWLRFEYFFYDLPKLPGYDVWKNDKTRPSLYHLDKDTLQQGVPDHMKVYSLETCMFILATDNINEMNRRYHNNFSNTYYGVHNDGIRAEFCAHINDSGRGLHLGTFTNEVAAAVYRDWYGRANNLPFIPNYEYPEMYPMSIRETLKYKHTANKEPYKSMHDPHTIRDFNPNEMCIIDKVPRREMKKEKRVMCRIIEK